MAESVTGDRPRFEHWFRCKSCSARYKVVRFTADSSKVKIPPCPRKSCSGKGKISFMPDIGMDVSAGRAPSTPSVQATAYDMAMKFAMEDSQSTNIQDHSAPGSVIRNGENSAPALPSHLQAQAQNFWGGHRKQNTRTARVDMSGIFGERAVAAQAGTPTNGANFSAGQGVAVAPILTAKPEGSSPVPDHRVLGSFNPRGR